MALFVRRRWTKVVAAVGVLAAVVLLVVLMTRDSPAPPVVARDTGDEVVETGEPLPDPTLPAVTMDALLTASDARLKTYDGYEVRAAGVRVQSVVGPSAVWVGDSAADRVFVLIASTEQSFDVTAGTRLSFTGTVRLAAPGVGRSLGLTGADVAYFERQGAYVEVTGYQRG
jgi:hypothetical protein